MKAGRLDEAEEKARKAERMGVVPAWRRIGPNRSCMKSR